MDNIDKCLDDLETKLQHAKAIKEHEKKLFVDKWYAYGAYEVPEAIKSLMEVLGKVQKLNHKVTMKDLEELGLKI